MNNLEEALAAAHEAKDEWSNTRWPEDNVFFDGLQVLIRCEMYWEKQIEQNRREQRQRETGSA